MKNNQKKLDLIKLYFEEKVSVYKNIKKTQILNLFKSIIYTYKNDGNVYILANGGSSAIGEGFAIDLRTHPFVSENKNKSTNIRRIKVFCLTESSGMLTGISNDLGFQNVFSEQLKNYLRSKKINKYDNLICLSSSGNSENVINAIKFAKKYSVKTSCIAGRGGGKACKIVDFPIIIKGNSKFPGQIGKNDNNFHIEDIQNSISHIITGLMKEYVSKQR